MIVYGYPATQASCGGCTHFVISPKRGGGVMTIGFGQGVVGHSDCSWWLGPDDSCMEVRKKRLTRRR